MVLIAGPTLGLGATAVVSCTQDGGHLQSDGIHAPDRDPVHPAEQPEELQFFTTDEARRVDAVVARILPGDEDDPGAVQGGVTTYIDQKLASFEDFADPAFMRGPFAEGRQGGEDTPEGDDVIYVEDDQLYRYGYQSGNTPQSIYREGLDGLERYAQTRYGAPFPDLDEEQQDQILITLDDVHQRSEAAENGNDFDHTELDQAEDMFAPIDPGEFFETVRVDVIEGMFADPIYGGNRGLAGWSLVGYPGAQRSYTAYEMMHGTDKQPVSLEGLTPMQPDRGDGQPALEQHHHQH